MVFSLSDNEHLIRASRAVRMRMRSYGLNLDGRGGEQPLRTEAVAGGAQLLRLDAQNCRDSVYASGLYARSLSHSLFTTS